MDELLVSVCIPTYNGEKYLEEALASVEAQTYSNLEVVISDDQSSDRTLEIVNVFAAQSRFPVRVFNHAPAGIGANWNHCIANAKGDYIKWLFQDDKLLPQCIEKLVNHSINTSNHQPLKMVFCRRELIGEVVDKKDLLTKKWDQFGDVIRASDVLKAKDLYKNPRNVIGEPPSVLLHKSIFEEVGLFDETLKQSLDYEFWYRVLAKMPIGFVDQVLTEFRVHQEQATKVNSHEILIDVIRLPYLLLTNLFSKLHPYVKMMLFFKVISGVYRYYLGWGLKK